MEQVYGILIIVGVVLFALLTIGLIFAKLYAKATKEEAFVRTGLGGEKVIMNGGAIVLPVLHDIIVINMRTVKLEVRRNSEQALITRDRMRVDVTAEFYLRVAPSLESISTAAQTLGERTLDPNALKELIEGKFVDVLRSVAAEMAMEELHEQRTEFVQKVQNNVKADLEKNGLELESVSLTSLDQTDPSYFRPENAFDAEGLTKLTEITELKRKERNDITRETEVHVARKNLETEKEKLEIEKGEEAARLQKDQDVAVLAAEQKSVIATETASNEQEAKQAEINAQKEIDSSAIAAEKEVEEKRIEKEKLLAEQRVGKEKTIAIAEQDKVIAIADKSKEESLSEAEANKARAEAVKEEERVTTVRETAQAERKKDIELIGAQEEAQKDAIELTVAAEAEKRVALDQAEAIKTKATANAEAVKIEADANAEAKKLAADADGVAYAVEAEGKEAINEAENKLSSEIVDMRLKEELYKALPDIIAQAVKPMENIDSIKIVKVDGLTGNGSGGSSEGSTGGSNLADQVTNAALNFKAQSPLIDTLLKEVGIDGSNINGLTAPVTSTPPTETGE